MTQRSPIDVTMTGLGAQGDGLAETPRGVLYVPFALPGERVQVQPGAKKGEGQAAKLIEVLERSPDRVDPACPHFGRCGGCALQHLGDVPYADFKRDLVRRALSQRGLNDVEVTPPVIGAPGARRRTRLTARRTGKGIVLGYAERASHHVIDVQACPVLEPIIEHFVPPLRDALADLLDKGGKCHITITTTATGLDMVLGADHSPGLAAREHLVRLAEAQDIARISWQDSADIEPIVVRRDPVVRFGALNVGLPPGAFLQASLAAEQTMADYAVKALEGATHIADLFAGCGTFSGALAAHAPVVAFEGDPTMVVALSHAAKRTPGLKPLAAHQRDLFRDPLTLIELKAFEGVVIDPPRAGAKAQTEVLADSSVPVIVAFSCNPATFARDARMLVEGGYRLKTVTPIDQFLWSAHVELMAVFQR